MTTVVPLRTSSYADLRPQALRLAAVLGLALCACSPPPQPPDPSAIEAEPLVEQRILEATQAVREAPTSSTAWGRLGEIYDVHRFGEQALVCYRRAAGLDSNEWRWPYFAGLVLRESDQDAAIAEFRRAVELQPDYAPLHFYLGQGYLLTEQIDLAAQQFERALELDPGSVNASLGLARVALVRDDPDAALARLQEAVRHSPYQAAVHHHLAQVYRRLGQQDEAKREELIARSSPIPMQASDLGSLSDPVRDEVILREGVSSRWLVENSRRLMAQGQPAAALGALEKALIADPDSVVALLESARLLSAQGDFLQARQRIERALEIDTGNAPAHAELGNVLGRSGDVEGAIREWKRAIEIDPGLAEAQNNLAALLFETGRAEEGLARLREAAQAIPGDVDLQYNLAGMLMNTGQYAEAAEVLESTIALHPDFAPAIYLLGSVRAMQGSYQEAVALFRRVVQRTPGNVEVRLDLARALWELDRYDESIATFREARQLAPDNAVPAAELAWALATCPRGDLRDGSQSLAIARRLSEESGYRNPKLLDVLAAAQAETGDFQGAFTTARRALQIAERVLASGNIEDPAPARDFITQVRERAALYQSGRPYHQR